MKALGRTGALGAQELVGSVAGRGGAPRRCLTSRPLPAGSPYALIVRRYLSLLDAAVELEFRDYSGPRLDPRYRVLMFEHALTADEANRKYRSVVGADGVLGRGRDGRAALGGESVVGSAVASTTAGGQRSIACDTQG